MDGVLFRKDILWDEIGDEQRENAKNKAIGACLMMEIVEGKIICAGSTTNRFLARLNEQTKESFLEKSMQTLCFMDCTYRKKLQQLTKEQQGKDKKAPEERCQPLKLLVG